MSAGRRGPVLIVEHVGRGGIADYTGELGRALADRHHLVELVTARDHLYPVIEGVRVHGLFPFLRGTTPRRRMMRLLRLHKLWGVIGYLLATPRLFRLARRSEVVHLQHGTFPPLDALTALIARAAGRPLVYTPHNVFDRGRGFPGAHGLLARAAARTIVHAQADLPELAVAAARRAVVIPHGEYGSLGHRGGPADRAASRAELEVPDGSPLTLLFGQLRPDKGLRDLLEAVRRVPELWVLVSGEDVGALASAAELLSDPELSGRVLVREGFQPMSEVAKLFAATDTVVLPYPHASQSGVLFLAYGFARPVVVYPVGGLVEAVIDGETGWICPRADQEALSATLSDAVAAGSQECMRRGAAGARLAAERYSWSEIAKRTDALYGEVVQERERGRSE